MPPAISDRVWPRCTVMLPSAATAGAGAGRAGAGARGAAAVLRAGTGLVRDGVASAGCDSAASGSATAEAASASRTMALDIAPSGATISGSATATALSGASTSAEYSRTRRPCPQSASIRKFSDGVVTGAWLLTRTTARPWVLRVSSNCSSLTRPVGRSRPTRANVTGEASATRRFSSSDGSAEMIGISASNGWPGLDSTRMSPRPRAMAELLARASSRVDTTLSGRFAPGTRFFMPAI